MSQDWNTDVYDKDARTADVIMQDVEKMLDTLQSSFSGGSAPSNIVAFMPWGDTAKGLKRRNIGNTAWLAILHGDANQKMWVYRNDTCEGWVIDATVTDRVLAVKGGSNAYNVNGGVAAGTWTQPGHTLAATEIPDHAHSGTVDSDGAHTHDVNTFIIGGAEDNQVQQIDDGTDSTDAAAAALSAGAHTHSFTTDTDGGGDLSHNHGTTYRPAAAVGTLQYPDL